MTSAAQLKLRRKYEAEDPGRLQIKMWFHPFGTYVAIAAMLVILVAKGLDPAASKELWLSLLVAAGFAAAFFVFRRRVA
jgi:GABA permease